MVCYACLVAVITGAAGWDDDLVKPLERYQASEVHMGTTFSIVLYASDEMSANGALRAAFDRIARLDETLSDYRAESEISRLGAASPTAQPVPVSDDVWEVLAAAQKLSVESGGAFDVTVGPLTRLWRRARRQKEMPAEARLAEARQAVGHPWLELHPDSQSVSLRRPGMRLDLGGIAKGYAVDKALQELSRQGITRALVNGGGDLGASGPPPDAAGWRVGIAPLGPDAPPSRFVELCHRAIATSGDAFQFVELDGIRYSHILDPRTGRPLTRRSSVTVLAATCTTADALASAVTVLGPKAGRELVDSRPDVDVLILTVDDDGQVQVAGTGAFGAEGSK